MWIAFLSAGETFKTVTDWAGYVSLLCALLYGIHRVIKMMGVSQRKQREWCKDFFVAVVVRPFFAVVINPPRVLWKRVETQISVPHELALLNQSIAETNQLYKFQFERMDQNFEDGRMRMDAIAAQFMTNGGGSLRDAINRIENRGMMNSDRLTFLDEISPKAIFKMDVTATGGEAGGNVLKCSAVNPALCSLVGYSEKELLRLEWLQIFANPDEVQTAMTKWQFAVTHKTHLTSYQSIRHGKTGEIIKIKVQARPCLDAKSKLQGFDGYVELLQIND